MRKVVIILILAVSTVYSKPQNYRYKGIKNDIKILDPYWNRKEFKQENKDRDIKQQKESFEYGLNNYNLGEYSLIIEYLCEEVERDTAKNFILWKEYMDSLLNFVKTDSVHCRRGVVPLEIEMFLATLELNKKKLNSDYPIAYNFLLANTPLMRGYEYKEKDYIKILKEYGYDYEELQWVHEQKGIFYDMLLLEDFKLISIIKKDKELLKIYEDWLSSCLTDHYCIWFEITKKRSTLMICRKRLYLEFLFKNSKDKLTKKTGNFIEEIQIFRKTVIPEDHYSKVLTGKWKGMFGTSKVIVIELNTLWMDGEHSKESIEKYKNKFVTSDSYSVLNGGKEVSIEGGFEDKGEYYECQAKELPEEKEYNGVFKFKVYKKEPYNMEGEWISNNGKFKREYNLEKQEKKKEVLIHIGNYFYNSIGCLLIGETGKSFTQPKDYDHINSGDFVAKGTEHYYISSSRKKLSEFIKYMENKKHIKINITR